MGEERIGRVGYSSEVAAFTVTCNRWKDYPLIFAEDIEVIGNVYENPDLLGECN